MSSDTDSNIKVKSVFGQLPAPDEQWLATTPAEDILFPDLPIIDPHHHLWHWPGNRYFAEEYLADASTGHNIVATVYAECSSMYRATGPDAMKPVGETEFVVGQAAICDSGHYGSTRVGAGIIGNADLRLGSGVKPVLEAHVEAGNGRFRGIRIQASYDASDEVKNSPFVETPDLMMEERVLEGARELAKMGLVLEVFCFFTQLPQVAALADALPDLTVVINHCGSPLGFGPYAQNRDEHYKAWKAGIEDLAKRPNVICKVGGLITRRLVPDFTTAPTAPSSEVIAAMWRPWLEPSIEAFGPDRSMFESNFPVERRGMTFAALWNAFKRIAATASGQERDALFAGTARRVYKL